MRFVSEFQMMLFLLLAVNYTGFIRISVYNIRYTISRKSFIIEFKRTLWSHCKLLHCHFLVISYSTPFLVEYHITGCLMISLFVCARVLGGVGVCALMRGICCVVRLPYRLYQQRSFMCYPIVSFTCHWASDVLLS